MKLLEAINIILPALGESVVTSIDSRNPTVAIVRNAIQAQNSHLQLRDWWFNTFDVGLYPDEGGEIVLPSNLMAWLPDEEGGGIQRGNRLLNPESLDFKWPVGTPVTGKIRVRVDFEDLPESAATHVMYEGCIKAYVDDIGLEQVLDVWRQRSGEAYIALMSEHLRNKRFSTRRSRRYRRIRSAIRG